MYEAATKFSEVGAGIGVWRRTWQILKTMGLEHDLLQLLDRRPSDDVGTIILHNYGTLLTPVNSYSPDATVP